MIRLHPIHSRAEFESLGGIWNQLLARSPSNNFFLSWDWIWQWWLTFSRKTDRLVILALMDKGEIVGLAPFYTRTIRLFRAYPVRRLMFIGTQEDGEGDVCSDYMDIFCHQGLEKVFVDEIFRFVMSSNPCDDIYLSRVDKESPTIILMQAGAKKNGFLLLPEQDSLSPYIQLPETWEGYLASLSSSMRAKIGRERRKLMKGQQVSISTATTEGEALHVLKELINLHQKRWIARGGKGSFSNPQFLEFHRKIVSSLTEKGHVSLTLLTVDGEHKAALYNFIYNTKVYFYQSGVDTASGMPAFGYVLHSHCIEAAIARGLDEYDFLPKGDTDDYKDRFSNARREVTSVYMVCSRMVKCYVGMRRAGSVIKKKVSCLRSGMVSGETALHADR